MQKTRLQIIASFLEPTDVLADIGCDHGYLGILALQKGISYVQCIDNKIGPLSAAKKNLKNYDNVEFTLASGITSLNNLVSVIAICGMGGQLIIDILNQDLTRLKKLKKIILQPNSDQYLLRTFLSNHQFEIIDEKIVYENNKYYEIIVCRYKHNFGHYTTNEQFFGPILLKNRSLEFLNKWTLILGKYRKIKSSLSISNLKLEQDIERIEKMLKQ